MVLLEDRCPAYITPQRFWANQERLAANRARTEAARSRCQGPSLLEESSVAGVAGNG